MNIFELTVLIDNNGAFLYKELETEHGLSFYFEIDGLSWLYDVGASDKWAQNADRLGIDLQGVDNLILSHGHRDHTGGLSTFLELNAMGKVFASEKIFSYRYFTHRHGLPKEISTDLSLLNKYVDRFVLLKKDIALSPNVRLVFNKVYQSLFPSANKYLSIIEHDVERAYVADDELALAICTSDGLVVLSACSHCGILNIIQSCVDATGCNKVVAFIGGTHLIDSELENEDDVEGIAKILQLKYPEMKLYTGHCTGRSAIDTFSEILQNRFALFHSGMHLTF